jgi:hypothetical protein
MLYRQAYRLVVRAIDNNNNKTITSIAYDIGVSEHRMARLLDTLDLRVYLAEAKRGKNDKTQNNKNKG